MGVEGGNAPTHYVLINAVTSPATRWLLIRSYSRYSPQTWRWTIWRNTNARPARPVTYARISSGHRVGRTNQAVHIISKMSKYIGRQRESTEGNRRNGGAIETNLYTGRPRVRMRIPWNGLTVSSHTASSAGVEVYTRADHERTRIVHRSYGVVTRPPRHARHRTGEASGPEGVRRPFLERAEVPRDRDKCYPGSG